MPVKVMIPTPLRPYVGNQAIVEIEGANVGELLRNLTAKHSELKPHLYSTDGKLRSFVNVYLNDEDIRYLRREETPVTGADTVSIVPSVAGGTPTTAAPDVALPELSKEEIRRYSRHLIMPEVGIEGQRRLKAARVLCVGAGGLGSPAALYLAAAGVGTLGLVDYDVVDASNLQRQILFSTADVGRPKVEAARDRLRGLNPDANVVAHEMPLKSSNALEILRDYDVIVDGADNFPTRYLVNDACVLLGKPNAYGSIFRFDGQASVFATKGGPCYRCLYPEPPPPGLVPSCAEGGVLGVLPGIIGIIQATEAIKLILGAGETLIGRLLLFDALQDELPHAQAAARPGVPGVRRSSDGQDADRLRAVLRHHAAGRGRRGRAGGLRDRRRRTEGPARPARSHLDPGRPGAERVRDLPHSRLDVDPARRAAAAARRAAARSRRAPDRRALQGGRAQRKRGRAAPPEGVPARDEPEGRHPLLDRPRRSESAEVLTGYTISFHRR